LRLEIGQRRQNLDILINRLQGGGPMIRGSIYARRRKCGKPRCLCVRGHPHKDRVLAVRHGGRVTVSRLDSVGDAAIEEAVLAWRLFRRQRRELAETCRALVQGVDRLGCLRQAKAGELG
jgi:hypothetical protein